MASWRNIKKKRDSLDEKVANSKIGRTIFSRTAKAIALGTLITTALVGGVKYHNWRSEPVYRPEISAVAPRNYNPNKASLANKLLQDFPDEIPGAKSIDKYITPSAEYCLVHVRQMHVVYKTDENGKPLIPKEDLERVPKVQNSIYDILSYLHKDGSLNKESMLPVYKEGILADMPSLEDCIKYKNKIERKKQEFIEVYKKGKDGIIYNEDELAIESANEFDSSFPDVVMDLNSANNLIKLYEESTPNRTDAVYRLSKEGKVKELGYESIDTYSLANFSYENDLMSASTMIEWRDDAFIKRTSEREIKYAIVVLGGIHAFGGNLSFGEKYRADKRHNPKDNIAKWNKKHPDKKFSLIEITPIHYEKK